MSFLVHLLEVHICLCNLHLVLDGDVTVNGNRGDRFDTRFVEFAHDVAFFFKNLNAPDILQRHEWTDVWIIQRLRVASEPDKYTRAPTNDAVAWDMSSTYEYLDLLFDFLLLAPVKLRLDDGHLPSLGRGISNRCLKELAGVVVKIFISYTYDTYDTLRSLHYFPYLRFSA